MMKKINNIKQLREVLRNIINTQDLEEIKNFNTLYDYSNITDMSSLWEEIEEKIKKEKIDWENIKFPIIDMKNVEIRNNAFKHSLLFEINLINTHNIKTIDSGFSHTKNLEKISLDLSFCEKRSYLFKNSNIKEVELLNTQNIKDFIWGFYKTENLEKISLDLSGCEERECIFFESNVKEVELLNTQNIKKIISGFKDTKNLEKLNSLYLDNCENMINCFEKTNLKEINLYNTIKVKEWHGCFWNSNIEEVELDMKNREDCGYIFFNREVKKINLKNCENIKNIEGFVRGCKNLDYLEINLTNVKNTTKFINEKNNIKYLKISGLKKFLKGKEKTDINNDFNEIFSISQEKKPIPLIESVKKNTSFNIIGDNNSSIRLEKKKEREKICELKKEKRNYKIKTEKEKIIEINL